MTSPATGQARRRVALDIEKLSHGVNVFLEVDDIPGAKANNRVPRTGKILLIRIEQTTDPDLHLLVDGQRCEAEWRGNLAVFRLYLPVREIWLVSRSARPQALGQGEDTRLLGYALSRLTIRKGGVRRDIPLDGDAPGEGFQDAEPEWRWTTGRAQLPVAAFARLRGMVELEVEGFPLPAYPAFDAVAADRDLMLGFESLGEDCEFGFVQRHFTAETFGLLRWGGTDSARLACGLRARFEGIGKAEHTELTWSENRQEYVLRDPRYLGFHTFITTQFASAQEKEEARMAGGARLRLLARKLITDIAGARRIFVFKTTDPGWNEEKLIELHAALRSVGPARLLCVILAPTPRQIGQVVARGEGLFIGWIDRFVGAEGPYDVWHHLCRTTRDMARLSTGAEAA